jgi:hypothetical protein
MKLDTTWDAVLRELTTFPDDNLQQLHGDANFMRAGRFRRNARRLFEEVLEPLIRLEGEIEVICGFVDLGLIVEVMEVIPDGVPDGVCEFRAAKVKVLSTGRILDVAIAV